MKKIIFWGGIILFIGSIVLIGFNYSDLKVERQGVVVKMKIEKLPNSYIGTKVKHFVTLGYNGESYINRVGEKFCDEHSVGELIDIKFLKNSSTVLFLGESVILDLLSFAILGIFGAGISLYQWKK
jgi:hypothetical protein